MPLLIDPGTGFLIAFADGQLRLGEEGDPCCCEPPLCLCSTVPVLDWFTPGPGTNDDVFVDPPADFSACAGSILPGTIIFWSSFAADVTFGLEYVPDCPDDGAGGHNLMFAHLGGFSYNSITGIEGDSSGAGASTGDIFINFDEATCEFVLTFWEGDTYTSGGMSIDYHIVWQGRKPYAGGNPLGVYTRSAGCCLDAIKTVSE